MREDEALRLLRALLDGEGAEWVEEGGWIRFRMRREAMLWETAARPCADGLLYYGRFPSAAPTRTGPGGSARS
jgi:hypothetical protein